MFGPLSSDTGEGMMAWRRKKKRGKAKVERERENQRKAEEREDKF